MDDKILDMLLKMNDKLDNLESDMKELKTEIKDIKQNMTVGFNTVVKIVDDNHRLNKLMQNRGI